MHQRQTQRRSSRGITILSVVGLLSCTGMVVSAQQLEQPADEPSQTTPTRPVQANTDRPTQPAARGRRRSEQEPTITFQPFSEPMELTTLIDFVGASMGINIVVKGSPTGEIVFNAPKRIEQDKLIDFLDAMLELYAFTISFDPDSDFYVVSPITDLKPVFGTQRATTLIIPTPNIKPSLLIPALTAMLGSSPTTGTTRSAAIQAVDELGVLIINAPPRDINRVEQMVKELIRLDADMQYIRFELDHLAAPTALDRVGSLVGGSSSGTSLSTPQGGRNNQGGGQGNALGGGGRGSLSNLTDRLTVDPQGNALIFKGTQDEIDRVYKVLAVIDVPNTLEPKSYFAGSSAAQIADIARGRGLGEVIEIEAAVQQNPFNNFGGQNQQFNQSNNDLGQGGPVMVVDAERGNIIYYGTDDQQAQLATLLKELKTDDERIVREIYGLNHTDALIIQDLLNGIMFGEQQTGNSDLLPGGSGRNTTRSFINGFPVNGEDSAGAFDPNQITITADENSNQSIINAPIKQQDEIELLISQLDKQRPQVYIQAMIVSIADNEDFTLAFETQILAGQSATSTNFGLSNPGASFQDPRTVATGLAGLTHAVIKSNYVPIILNATQTNTDARILSTPQLLVNDNEESTIASVSEQPFTTVTPTNGGSAESFGGFEEAGTTLTVTPSISKGGFIRLQYSIEFSNFTSATGIAGSPPPRDRNTLTGSVTVPNNYTVVLGGITVEDIRDTIIKVPLLGDIPLVGELFKKTNKVNNRSKIYVFLTPRIMTDPNFNDLKIESEGPQSEMGIDGNVPELEPVLILAPGVAESSSLPVLLPAPSEFAPVLEATNEHAPEPTPAQGAPELTPAMIELNDSTANGGE